MKSIRSAVLLILLVLIAAPLDIAAQPATATPPLVATLTLPHDTVLPGVPFDMIVTFKNTSVRPLTITGARAYLIVTLPNGEKARLHEFNDDDGVALRPEYGLDPSAAELHLAPGASGFYVMNWDHGSIPTWSLNESFSGPGTYHLALDLGVGCEPQCPGLVRTSTARLNRVLPAGEDEMIWNKMQEVANGRWSDALMSSVAAAEFVGKRFPEVQTLIMQHPGSGYYPYVVALRGFTLKNEQNIPVLLKAAKRFPDSPAYPYLLKAAGDTALYVASKAGSFDDDRAKAEKYYVLAETAYQQALATKSLMVKASAEMGVRTMKSDRESMNRRKIR